MVETISDNPDSAVAADPPTEERRKSVALRWRTALLMIAALSAGFVLGRINTADSLGFAVALVGLAVAAAVGVSLAWAWIAQPIRRFADQLDGLALAQRQVQVRALPTDRDDELGRMARAVRELIISRIRDHHDARQLRRTLDDRVSRATQKAVNTLSKMAMRDPLTDLGNRRFLDAHLPTLIAVSRESDTDLICVMIDMDNFKQVNDTLGHGTGDDLLVALAELIRSAIREDDLAIRFGGDEFVVFMPGATLDRAQQFATHIRTLFRQRAVALVGGATTTDLSVGAASLREENCADGDALIDTADHHLYVAKRNGKGMTCTVDGCLAA